ncbi:MAG TPA: hypothetical protein PLR98_03440 [Chitinophagaceae bacterium]|nr:hypothetical protein [Chitinophagaceae bacterium]
MIHSKLARLALPVFALCSVQLLNAQYSNRQPVKLRTAYTGIEVGSKGVKMSILELKNSEATVDFRILKDTAVNTDFISFSPQTFDATLKGLIGLYITAAKEYDIPSKRIFTVISSGVKMQAEKSNKTDWINNLIDSFRLKINDPYRKVDVVDVQQEARLSHLDIVPESKRYSTFLIDIGSGNTKGGFFPYGDLSTFRLFQLNWGTKSVSNATEKRCEHDNSLDNYNRQLSKVLGGAENTDIIYAVNASGSYKLSDNIAVSGGAAWAVANLTHPEMTEDAIVPVTYKEVEKLCEKLYNNFDALAPAFLAQNITRSSDREQAIKNIKAVQKVFDQKALMAGAGLLLKIMRQFSSAYETKQYFLVKNGSVGWISAYVDQSVEN